MKGRSGKPIWQPRVGRVVQAAVLPFLAAVVLGSLFFRASSSSRGTEQAVVRHPSRVLEETQRPAACIGVNCGGQGASAPAVGASTGFGAVSSGRASAGGAAADPRDDLPQLFLFIGILSGRGYRHRRLAVREAWSNKAQVPGQVVAKFILSEDERTPQVEKELEAYGDIVFVREKTNYKSILYKTFYVLEYAANNYDAAFVLKTDDDAFINVFPMMEQLRALCENKDCRRERLYMGRMAKHSEVLLQPGHKWNNAAFHNHTGLKEYPNYMMGGGYVVGGEVARVLVDVHNRMRLKFTPIEDATLGFWLMSMDLRHIDHPKFYTWAAPCCFKAPVRKPGERFVTRFQLADEFEDDLCSNDPWLVLHKIDSPTKMRYVGARVANCSRPDPWALAPSIEEHVSPETRAYFAQQKAAALQEQRKQPLGGSGGGSAKGLPAAQAAGALAGIGGSSSSGGTRKLVPGGSSSSSTGASSISTATSLGSGDDTTVALQ